ncbi:MAG: ABC transporter substrate-binding protein, partial [Actinomycetota bacterium]
KDTVKVAWLDVSKSTYEAAAQFGTSSGTTNDYLYYLTPFVDEINATGGINGRKLVVNVIEYDPKNRDDQLAACVNAAEDAKVFAALTGYMSTGEACLADKQVPVITYNSVSADRLYRQEKGWVRETAMNQDRLVKNLVDWLLQARVITSSTRIGVLTLENPEYKQVAESVLLPYLASKKLSVAAVASFSSQAERTAIEANNMVLQFKDKDVQFVFPAVTWWQLFHFLTQAQAQLYKPEYAALEMGGMTGDALASSLPADEWDGSRGITTTRSGESAAGKPETPEQKECLSAFSARGGKIDTDTDRQFTLLACQQLHLFAKSARLAGAQLTRQSFFAALDSLGAYRERVSAADTLTFRKGKYDAADRFAVVQWRKDCKCYHQIEGFRPSSW